MHDATDIRAQLEQERRLIAEATDGPWEVMKERVVSEDMGLITPRLHSAPDATFIAHARTALPVRNAQIEAVLELHKPHWDNLPWRQMQPNVPGCTECYDEGHPFQYPCATVKAIEEATT